MGYTISGLSPEPFRHLYGLPDRQLDELGIKRFHVDQNPGFPDRIEMRDANVGETVLLLHHVYQPENSPYRASHAIFIREGAQDKYCVKNVVPEVMKSRLIALRAFDGSHMMVDAEIAQGGDIEKTIHLFFENPQVSYIQAHNAKRGCYSGRIDRD